MTPLCEIYTPKGRVIFGGRLISVTVSDEAGEQSDSCTIEVDDTAGELELPRKGVLISVRMGYAETRLHELGKFIVDEVTASGMPMKLTIKASSAAFNDGGGNYNPLQTRKTRSWAPGMVGALVSTIANEHGMTAQVAKDVAFKMHPQLEQTDESDINLLTRVARDLGAIVKPAGDKLVVAVRGAGENTAGKKLATVSLTPRDVMNYSAKLGDRQAFKRVVATWNDLDAAQLKEVSVGSGEPVHRIAMQFPDEASAKQCAQAQLDAFSRTGAGQISVTLPGRPELGAESTVALSGFRAGVSGSWRLTRATHTFSRQGLSTSFSAEGV